MGRDKIAAFRALRAAFILAAVLSAESCAVRQAGLPRQKQGAAGLQQGADISCRPDECFTQAVAHKKQGRTEEAKALLKEIIRLYPGAMWAGRASLQLGLMLSESGDLSSMDYFNEAVRLLDIDRHVMFHRANAERKLKLYNEAIRTYETVEVESTGRPLSATALFKKAETLEEADMPVEARDGFRDFVLAHPRHRLLPDALLKAATLSMLLNDKDDAFRYSRLILLEYPADRAAGAASEIYGSLISSGLPVLPWNIDERILRARGFFSAARYDMAAQELSPVIREAQGKSYAESAMLYSSSLMRLKRYGEAAASLKELLRRGAGREEREALGRLALIALRRSDRGLLDDAEKRLASSHPGTKERTDAMLYRAYLDESEGYMEKALSAYAEVIEKFPSTQAAMEAVWKTLWIKYRSGRHDEAYKVFSIHEASFKGFKGLDKLLYWAARSASKAGMEKEAEALYERLCFGFRHGYYCQMAEDRMGAIEGPDVRPAQGKAPPQSPPCTRGGLGGRLAEAGKSALFSEDSYLAAKELILSGLGKDASEELSFLAEAYADDRDGVLALAFMFKASGDYGRALAAYYRYTVLSDARGDMPVEIPELVYPAEAATYIREAGPSVPVDEYLAAAVMREESSFDPEAFSPAGAIGLMQLMPDTGRAMARAAGIAALDPAELFDPDTNARFGARYLAQLGAMFNWDLPRTVAAYNAGPETVKRWEAAGHQEADEFIESIPYRETRAYTKRVIESYGNYLRYAGIGARMRWTRFKETGIALSR
ncbi:MAG: lytic transglycosylase domain-containing protein [Deltaproteobacteria bacterium]|nr:lytic transglycosylase domain-containing protein [Deltaproteobacteria bacterium]